MRLPRKHFPPGVVRECKQFTIESDDIYRWDFAFRDPATGRVSQYTTEAWVAPGMTEEEFAMAVREPAVACLERMVHRKCGMDYALANQYPLELPRAVQARFV